MSEEQQEDKIPKGFTLKHTLEGHKNHVHRLAWAPDGVTLASCSIGSDLLLWDTNTGCLLRKLKGHSDQIFGVAWGADGQIVASSSMDRTVRLWDAKTGEQRQKFEGDERFVSIASSPDGVVIAAGSVDNIWLWDIKTARLIQKLVGHSSPVGALAWSPDGSMLASGSSDRTIRLWDRRSWESRQRFEGHSNYILSVAWSPDGQILASGSKDQTVRLWDTKSGQLIGILEGHTDMITSVSFSSDNRVLVSKGYSGTLRFWNCGTWELIAELGKPAASSCEFSGLAFHQTLPMLASLGVGNTIHVWELDIDLLLKQASEAIHYTTAKIVLVGDSGVGKTGLGWRLAKGEFKEHASTHGQQFWVVKELGTRRRDSTECEAILWDLAGQPDYRLTHALFLDDSDLALILFDPTDSREPLHGVEFWLKQFKSEQVSSRSQNVCRTILVGARADRGEARLTQGELDEFCRQRDILGGYLATSAKDGIGLDELLQRMKAQIPWEQKSAVVTTLTFKRIKDYVLGLKENPESQNVIVSPQGLRRQLESADEQWQFTDAEMMTAVRHLANYGLMQVLRTSKGEERILLVPDLLNNLAASFVLEARRNPKGLGSLEEKRLLAGEYQFRELEKLSPEERDVLLDAAALLFLEHNICFRETDPFSYQSYLVFPELINLKKPLLEDEEETEDGAGYTVSGEVENVYASLVILLAYTQKYTRRDQWSGHARYVMGDGRVCGFRQETVRDGELELVLYFGMDVPKAARKFFEGVFESFLERRNLDVFRYEPVICSECKHVLERAVVRDRSRSGKGFTFCNECGEKLTLPKPDELVRLTQEDRQKVVEQNQFATKRSQFEQVIFQVKSYVTDQKIKSPECFISYAWGNKELEQWVEYSLATDLQKAGIRVVLDRWDNVRGSVSRFVSRIAKCDIVIPVGTPLYFQKFENKVSNTGSIVASEVDLISQRLMGTENEKDTVIPILRAGKKEDSLPYLMWDRVNRDFTNDQNYFATAFDLILVLYGIAHRDPAVADLRESLRKPEIL